MILPLPRILWPVSRRSDRRNGGDLERWEAGDIAECVFDGPWINLATNIKDDVGPKKGDRFKVERTSQLIVPVRELFLVLSALPGAAYDARAFRKVRPCADEHTAADAAFTEQLRSQPKRLPAAPPRELEVAAQGLAKHPARCAP